MNHRPDISNAVLWRVARDVSTPNSFCNDSITIAAADLLLIENENRQCGYVENDSKNVDIQTKWKLSDVAIWARQGLKANRHAIDRKLAQMKPLPYTASSSADSYRALSVRMCDSIDQGPAYGKATVVRQLGACQKRIPLVDEVLQLTFYNVEVIHTVHKKLMISVFAEDEESRKFSHHDDYAWGRLHQSLNPPKLLPKVNCMFFHQNPTTHLLEGGLRSPAKWIQHSNLLLWLECPLPPSFATPSFVIVEAETESDDEIAIHTTRAIKLCSAEDTTTRGICDSRSIACQVGCIDEAKTNTDPQAKCCKRCQNEYDRYTRFDENDFWIPTSEPEIQDINTTHGHYLDGKDLSICLRPVFLETVCVECDGAGAISPQRLIEWIEYHILIGFDKIYVMDRYSTSLIPLLEGYIKSGRVIHVPFPFMSDAPLSPEARSDQSKMVPAGHDQVMAYEYCLSQGRLHNDAFMAFIDSDEFIRYPKPRAGMLRSVIMSLLSKHWNSYDLPDSISLDRFDVQVEPEGLALGYIRRSLQKKTHQEGQQRHGKVLVRPSAIENGAIWVHAAFNASGTSSSFRRQFVDGQNALISPAEKLSIYHYRQLDRRKWVATPTTYQGGMIDDSSLKWAYNIISSQFIATSGWKAASAMSQQGLLRLVDAKKVEKSDVFIDDRPSLFIGLLSYCSNRDRRDAIRETWLSQAEIQGLREYVRLEFRFVLGQPARSEENRFCSKGSIKTEGTIFGDLLVLEAVPESYQVLTRKTMAMTKWVADNIDPDFMLKTDDDSYIDLHTLIATFQQVESPDLPLYFGMFKSKSLDFSTAFDITPMGRWYTKPENFPVDAQRYAVGAGYALSRPLVQHISNLVDDSTFQIPWGPEDEMGWLEDGAMGYLLRGTVNRAGRISAWHVNDLWYPFECNGDFDLMILHHLDASQQYDAHRIFSTEHRNTFLGLCKHLDEVFSVVSLAKAAAEERKRVTSWKGSFLERPLPPLLVNPPTQIRLPDFESLKGGASTPKGQNVIIVTGGCHNIGRHLVRLVQQGYSRMSGPLTVVVIASSASAVHGCFFPSAKEASGDFHEIMVETVAADIRDLDELRASLLPYAPNIRGVVHLAAISKVQDCASNVTKCLQVNVDGTKNIMKLLSSLYGGKSISRIGWRRVLPWILFASSREVYGALGPYDIVDEDSQLLPVNDYGKSKLEAELALREWAHKTKFNVVTLRFTNVYGSCHDNLSRLVPKWSASLISGRKLQIMNNDKKTVSLLHVQDAAQSILLGIRFASTLDNAAGHYEAFNIGGGVNHDILNITDVGKILQSSISKLVPKCLACLEELIVIKNHPRVQEPDHYRGSIDKAFRVLGFQPSQTFNEVTVQEYVQTCLNVQTNLHANATEEHLIRHSYPSLSFFFQWIVITIFASLVRFRSLRGPRKSRYIPFGLGVAALPLFAATNSVVINRGSKEGLIMKNECVGLNDKERALCYTKACKKLGCSWSYVGHTQSQVVQILNLEPSQSYPSGVNLCQSYLTIVAIVCACLKFANRQSIHRKKLVACGLLFMCAFLCLPFRNESVSAGMVEKLLAANVFEMTPSEYKGICNKSGNGAVPFSGEREWPAYIDYYSKADNVAQAKQSKIKFLALYFPQWYPAPVNNYKDDWVYFQNPNFTHNSYNIKITRPQNHIFYDSRCTELRRSQAALAKKFLLDGFVYYFYFPENEWVLSEVNRRMLIDGQPDIEFAFMWVNEEFAGRDVYYDKPELLAKTIWPFITHRNYLRVNGRPMFYIYAASNVPPDFIERLQRKLEEMGGLQLYIVAAIQQWMNQLVSVSFADSYAEFPPNIGPLWHSYGFTHWNHTGGGNYQLGMTLNFDNTPRKALGDSNQLPAVLSKGRSVPVFQPSPDELLSRCVARVRAWHHLSSSTGNSHSPEKFVLFFAWNEWSEQAALEPSDLHGYGYLEAVRKCKLSLDI
jgi:dTDP-glucose 4,6-dehydratase/UDP-glucose 4-epimerase